MKKCILLFFVTLMVFFVLVALADDTSHEGTQIIQLKAAEDITQFYGTWRAKYFTDVYRKEILFNGLSFTAIEFQSTGTMKFINDAGEEYYEYSYQYSMNDNHINLVLGDDISEVDCYFKSDDELYIWLSGSEVIFCERQTTHQLSSALFAFDEMQMLGGNVAAYRIGELWGIILSDGTIVTGAFYIDCFREHFSGTGQLMGFQHTLISVSDKGYYVLSDETGEETIIWACSPYGSSISWSLEHNYLIETDNGDITPYLNYKGGMRVYRDYPYFDTYTLVGNSGQPLYTEADQVYINDTQYSFYSSQTFDQNSIALVVDDNICYQIDYYGNSTVIGENAKAFLDRVAPYQNGGLWGYIDDYGTVLAECKYEDATSLGLYNGQYYAWVKHNGAWYTISFQDGTVIDSVYSTRVSTSIQTPTPTLQQTATPALTATPIPSPVPFYAALTSAELPPEYLSPKEDFQSAGLVQCNYPMVSLTAGIYYTDGTETQLVTTVYPFTYEYNIENITTISALSTLNDGPYFFKVSIKTEEATKELVSSPFFIGGKELQAILRFASKPKNAGIFSHILYHNEYRDISDFQGFWIAFNKGIEVLATEVVGLFDGSDDSRYQVNLYKNSIIETVTLLYPDEVSMDTSGSEICAFVAKGIKESGGLYVDDLLETLPDTIDVSSELLSGLYTLEALADGSGIVADLAGNLDILAELLEGFFRDYENGILVLETVSAAMGNNNNSAYQTAMEEVISEYGEQWEASVKTALKNIGKVLVEKGIEAAIKSISNIKSFSLYNFIIEGVMLVSGLEKYANTSMAFITADTNFSNAHSAYQQMFWKVYNGDHSVAALSTLKTCLDYTYYSFIELYECLADFVPISKRIETFMIETDYCNAIDFGELSDWCVYEPVSR